MSRRRRNNMVESLFLLVFLLAEAIVSLLVHIILFMYDLFTFFSSKYKQKSGHSFFKMYFSKGNYGEFALYRKAIRFFGKESVLTNIYLENKNTEMTEIDVLAVSTKGIYVFEMKNYAGYIYGSENDQFWTQVLNRWTKNKFYNPLRQNYAHTKAVESFLNIPKKGIVPIVVFSNRSKLSKIEINGSQNVFQFHDAIRFVKRYETNSDLVFSKQQKEEFLIKLLNQCHMSEEIKEKHLCEVKALQSQSENLSNR